MLIRTDHLSDGLEFDPWTGMGGIKLESPAASALNEVHGPSATITCKRDLKAHVALLVPHRSAAGPVCRGCLLLGARALRQHDADAAASSA